MCDCKDTLDEVLERVAELEAQQQAEQQQREALEAENEDLRAKLQAEQQQREALEAEVAALREKVDADSGGDGGELREVVKSASGKVEEAAMDAEEAQKMAKNAVSAVNSLSGRIDELEADGDGDDDQTPSLPGDVEPASSELDFFANVREHEAKDRLWDNEYRAVKVAKRWEEFASVGWKDGTVAWRRQDLREALTANMGRSPHPETVTRVWEKLEALGGDDVVDRRGGNGTTLATGERQLEMEKAVAEGLLDHRYTHLELLRGPGDGSGGGLTPVVSG